MKNHWSEREDLLWLVFIIDNMPFRAVFNCRVIKPKPKKLL